MIRAIIENKLMACEFIIVHTKESVCKINEFSGSEVMYLNIDFLANYVFLQLPVFIKGLLRVTG